MTVARGRANDRSAAAAPASVRSSSSSPGWPLNTTRPWRLSATDCSPQENPKWSSGSPWPTNCSSASTQKHAMRVPNTLMQLDSSDSRSPVASLREAPSSPTRGEGKKDRASPVMTPSRIHRLTLTHFRNYRAASLQARGDVVVLVGPNGAGKTNCLEAISFLSPGRGLRRATLEDVADNQGDGSWAVSAELEGALGLATLGTGIDAPGADTPTTSRRCRIDREPVSSATAFGDHLRMVWLTPAMDGLFLGAASERRRFFDRLVLAIDSEHSSRVSALDRSLRSRNRLLEVRNYDDHWCDAIERETAELAVAVAAMRGQTVTKLAAMLRARGAASAFPSADIMLDGWMENALITEPATSV